ncbi:MAG: integration host factor subunit beta [Paludibacteraceae bacterium]|jgi:DNA-binding protein HU-beta|nr:integration host factor subunit beta [Paludibacteraceae bacterium]
MTKAELVNAIAIETGYDKVTILNIVESGMNQIKRSVAKNESVYLRSFGSFIAKQRKEKIARDISKNISVVVPAHKVPAFKPAAEFAKAVL